MEALITEFKKSVKERDKLIVSEYDVLSNVSGSQQTAIYRHIADLHHVSMATVIRVLKDNGILHINKNEKR